MEYYSTVILTLILFIFYFYLGCKDFDCFHFVAPNNRFCDKITILCYTVDQTLTRVEDYNLDLLQAEAKWILILTPYFFCYLLLRDLS